MSKRIHLKVGNSLNPIHPDHRLNVQSAKNVVGAFYESLASYLFHAERWEGGSIYAWESDMLREDEPPPKSRYRPEGDVPTSLTPDLLRPEDCTFIEVKGGNSRSTYKSFTWQAELYDRIRRHATLPIYRPRVEYAFFLHNVLGMTKGCRTVGKLVSALARNTELCVLLDLDLVLKFEEWCGVVSYGDPEDPESYYYAPFYKLKPNQLRGLVRHPRECLDEIAGKDQLNYGVTTRMVGAQGGQLDMFELLEVDGTPLAPFPLMRIRRRGRSRRAPFEGINAPDWREQAHQEPMFDEPQDAWAPTEAAAWSEGDPVPF